MTVYQAEIDGAFADIAAAGLAATLRRRVTTGGVFDPTIGDEVLSGPVKATQAGFGTLSASAANKRFTVSSGNLVVAGFAVGQQVKLQGVPLANASPFTVAGVTTTTLTVVEAVTEMAAVARFTLYARPSGYTLHPLRLLKTRPDKAFGLMFERGDLTIGRATGLLIAAMGVTITPTPGDEITLTGDAEPWQVRGVLAVDPDGTPIIWKAVADR